MIKKIVLISLFVVFVGALVAGGVYRTTAKSANETRQETRSTAALLDENEIAAQTRGGQGGERQGQGLGSGGEAQGRNQKAEVEAGSAPSGGQGGQGAQGNSGQGQNGSGQRQGGNRSANEEGTAAQSGEGYRSGQGSSQGGGRQGKRSSDVESHEIVTFEGTVIQAPAAGVDMIVSTDSADIPVGTGPGYLQEMGFELLNGDTVQVSGFWEDGEFKAESITRDGEMIALRDESGRPIWSGAARGGQAGQTGQGNQGSGRQARDGSAQADL